MVCVLPPPQTRHRLRFDRSPKAFDQFILAKAMAKLTSFFSEEIQDPGILTYLMLMVFFHTSES
jgi:hypothetical protein